MSSTDATRAAKARPASPLAERRPMLRTLFRSVRPLTWLVIAAIATFMVQTSWMKWIDLLVDSGREFYLPWRVSLGEHLGRDFVHPYGPFSVYFNAGIFAAFGVAIRNIVFANLVI